MEFNPASGPRATQDPLTGIRLSDWPILTLVIVWGLLVFVGLYVLWRYAATPGDAGAPPAYWPTQSAIVRDGRHTLVVVAHPLCPCTRASLSELARLLAVCHDRVDTHVLFIAPAGTDGSWRNSDLLSQARQIPGVTVHVDTDRREARLLGAKTSGCCLLYGSDGRLLFQGGVTEARGHEGESEGRCSLEALLSGDGPRSDATSVFGCPLFERCPADDPTSGPALTREPPHEY